MAIEIRVNGRKQSVAVDGDTPLLWVLRDQLGLRGTKFGCGVGLCGACTVHLDGTPARSCILPVANVKSANVTTIEGVGQTLVGRTLQQTWVAGDVPQCGYCQGGQILSAAALLARTLEPSEDDIDSAMVGNVCRCGTYTRIRSAIHAAAGQLRSEKKS